MLARPFLSFVLADDALTRGLGDAEARVLVEWVVEQTENLADEAESEETTWREVERLTRRARSIARFVTLWCHAQARGAAGQLAATERFAWPLPTAAVDACELMTAIVNWENALAVVR